jgi:putative effector of murein hydrolase LrgA (UPF0299 family)
MKKLQTLYGYAIAATMVAIVMCFVLMNVEIIASIAVFVALAFVLTLTLFIFIPAVFGLLLILAAAVASMVR